MKRNKIKRIKIEATMVFLTMVLASIPVVLAEDPCPENPGCGWSDHNEAPGKITTKATVVGCNGPCPPAPPTGTGEGGNEGEGTNNGNGDGPPIIKCKWEYDLQVTIDEPDPCDPTCECCPDLTHDACPCEPGLQVKPRLGKNVKIGYYAIVTDPNGKAHIDRVFADIWHPDRSFKYQIELKPLGVVEGQTYEKQEAMDAWEHVKEYHDSLITWNENWVGSLQPPFLDPYDDVDNELVEELAYVYYGERTISYCQPAGCYYVGIIAVDKLQMWSPYLYNWFWYIPTAAIKVDFTEVNYGNVLMSTPNICDGDDDMDTPLLPTVKNVGNVPVFLEVEQDSMGFEKTDTEWNVEFQARMNENGKYTKWYKPEELTKIPGNLKLCTEDKLDFLIHVIKGFPLPDGAPNIGKMELWANINHDKDWKTNMEFDPAPAWIEDPLTSFGPCCEVV